MQCNEKEKKMRFPSSFKVFVENLIFFGILLLRKYKEQIIYRLWKGEIIKIWASHVRMNVNSVVVNSVKIDNIVSSGKRKFYKLCTYKFFIISWCSVLSDLTRLTLIAFRFYCSVVELVRASVSLFAMSKLEMRLNSTNQNLVSYHMKFDFALGRH